MFYNLVNGSLVKYVGHQGLYRRIYSPKKSKVYQFLLGKANSQKLIFFLHHHSLAISRHQNSLVILRQTVSP